MWADRKYRKRNCASFFCGRSVCIMITCFGLGYSFGKDNNKTQK